MIKQIDVRDVQIGMGVVALQRLLQRLPIKASADGFLF